VAAITLLMALERMIQQRIPNAQVRLEGDYICIHIPESTVKKMLADALPPDVRSAADIELRTGGCVIKLKLR